MSKPIVSDEGEATKVTSGDESSDSSQMVKYESYAKVLSQKKAQDEKLRELQSKLAEHDAAEAVKREAQLRDEKRHDEIISELKKQNEALSGRLGQVQSEIANSMKRQALEREIGGFAHPDYAKFAQLDSIPLAEDGSVDLEALSREAARIREVHPHLLKTSPASLPNGSPVSAVGGTKPAPTAEELYYAEIEERTGIKIR